MKSIMGIVALALVWTSTAHASPQESSDYDELVELHEELRAYMVPGFTAGVVLESGARIGAREPHRSGRRFRGSCALQSR